MNIFRILAVVAIAVIAQHPLCAQNNHTKRTDPIVGVWVGTILDPSALPNGEGFFAQTLNTDKTAQTSTTLGNQQALLGFPGGVYGSDQHGTWKRIGKRRYKVATTSVANLKDLTNPIYPGIPLSRVLVEYTATLSKDCKSYTFEGKESFFEISDPTFTQPIRDSNTGDPVVIPFSGSARRFCQLGRSQ